MPVGFGFGVGDFVAAGGLAWKLYKRCKDAPQSYHNISQELLSLHAVLLECDEVFAAEIIPPARARRVKTVTDGVKTILEELQAIVDNKEIEEIRSRLISNTNMLLAFLNTSQGPVLQKVDAFMREFHEGRREGSVVSELTEESFSDGNVQWRAVLCELEEHGITAAMFEANKEFIINWFTTAVRNAAFQEEADDRSSQTSAGTHHSEQVSLEGPSESVEHHDQLRYLSRSLSHHAPHGNDGEERLPANQLNQSRAAREQLYRISATSSTSKTVAKKPRNNRSRVELFFGKFTSRKKALIAENNKDSIEAIERDDSASLKTILDYDLESSLFKKDTVNNALMTAIQHSNAESVRFLITAGAEINGFFYGRSQLFKRPLRTAMLSMDWEDTAETRQRKTEVCRAIIEAGASASNDHYLAWAAEEDNLEVCKLLVEGGAPIDGRGLSGQRSLHPLTEWAGHSTNGMSVGEYLIEAGANVNCRSSYKGTPLLQAAWWGSLKQCQLLVEKGANVNSSERWEISPLAAVARESRVDICQFLISKGADVNWPFGPYGTPLRAAAAHLNKDVCALLIEAGADPNLGGKDPRRGIPLSSPIEVAIDCLVYSPGGMRKQEQVIQLLRDAGA